MRRALRVMLVTMVILLGIPCTAVANGPPPDTSITIRVTNAPAETAYIDILVEKSLEAVVFSNPNKDVLELYPDTASPELVGYENGGYVSYSLYYRHKEFHVGLPDVNFSPGKENHFPNICDSSIQQMKIVLLDQSGKILHMSGVISLQPDGNTILNGYTPKVQYDCKKKTAQVRFPVDTASSGFLMSVFFLVILALIRITFSTITEVLISLPFKIKPIKTIVLVNLITQIVISIGMPTVSMMASYTFSVVVFEIFVYVTEFLAYLKFTREPKWKNVLLYTVTANTASLLLGLLLNAFGLFWA